MLALLVLPALAFDDAACDLPPSAAVLAGLDAGPVTVATGERWYLLGRSVSPPALVATCERAPGASTNTVKRQWLVERTATSVGLVGDSSFEEAFTGPVTLTAPTAFAGAVWEVCGPWAGSEEFANLRASRACLLVSPSAVGGGDHARSVVRVERGEYVLAFESPPRIGVASAWVATPTGGRIEETWTVDAATGKQSVTARTEVRWDPVAHDFVVTPPACAASIQAIEAAMGEYALLRCPR